MSITFKMADLQPFYFQWPSFSSLLQSPQDISFQALLPMTVLLCLRSDIVIFGHTNRFFLLSYLFTFLFTYLLTDLLTTPLIALQVTWYVFCLTHSHKIPGGCVDKVWSRTQSHWQVPVSAWCVVEATSVRSDRPTTARDWWVANGRTWVPFDDHDDRSRSGWMTIINIMSRIQVLKPEMREFCISVTRNSNLWPKVKGDG